MANNVKFVRTTKEKWLNRDTYDNNALYFCIDTQELYVGDKIFTDGIRVIPSRNDLPECPSAPDGVLYYIKDTKNGYVISPSRDSWIQVIYAPAADAYTVPEEDIYTTVATVGAVRDIEAKIYERIDNIDSGIGNLIPVDGTISIVNAEDGNKSISVAIAPIEGNILTAVEGGLFVPSTSVKIAEESHGLVAVNGEMLINLATTTSDGAMSKEDKKVLEELKALDISNTYVTKDEIQSVEESVSSLNEAFTWIEV